MENKISTDIGNNDKLQIDSNINNNISSVSSKFEHNNMDFVSKSCELKTDIEELDLTIRDNAVENTGSGIENSPTNAAEANSITSINASINLGSIGGKIGDFIDGIRSQIFDFLNIDTEDEEFNDAINLLEENNIFTISADDIEKIEHEDNKMKVILKNGNRYEIDEESKQISFVNSDGDYFYFDKDGDIISCSNNNASDIFNLDNTDDTQYGGNQMSFLYNDTELLENEDVMKIMREKFPDATDEDYILYFHKIANVGCRYTALVNNVFKAFQGKEQQFKDTFGYSMYNIDKDGNISFNYEPLILAFFTYTWYDREGMSIEEIYGNIADIEAGDSAATGETSTGATGLPRLNTPFFQFFLSEYYGIEYGMYDISFGVGAITQEQYIEFTEEGHQVNVSAAFYDLYTIDPETGERGELRYDNYGAHAMTVTGFTESGDIIVSSWGERYILDLSEATGVIYETYKVPIGTDE